MNSELAFIASLPALQQPAWQSHPDMERVRVELNALPPLVDASDVARLQGDSRIFAASMAFALVSGARHSLSPPREADL